MKPLAIADLFCGAGGTSAGAVEAIRALGYQPKLTAINHWDVAIATHTANHPEARHLCTSLDNINPRHLFREDELEILWASPECTHHSVARGGKPINDQSRATAWCVVRWAEALRPNIILVENVPEFETWGAIGANGRPLKTKRGATFLAWVNALESLGYAVDWRVLCAADYGDPTTRRRLFVQAVRGRRKVVWPEPTHAPAEETDLLGSRKAWVAAREIIDWSLTGQSIYERKRPLSDKTMKRIMVGLERFGLKSTVVSAGGPSCNARPVDQPMGTILTRDHRGLATPVLTPFLVPAATGERRVRSVDVPLHTVVTGARGEGLAQPYLICMEHGQRVRDIDRPMPTITTAKGGAIGVAQPFLVQVSHGNGAMKDEGNNRRAKSLNEPIPAVSGSNDWAVAEPALLPQSAGGILRSVEEPAPTVATAGAIALVEPYLVKFYGTGTAASVDNPLDTCTAKARFGLARPMVIVNGERYLLDIRFRMLQPHELAGAQGFKRGYQFSGTKTEQVKQIGNAVPRRLARALCLAVVSQKSNVADLLTEEEAAA